MALAITFWNFISVWVTIRVVCQGNAIYFSGILLDNVILYICWQCYAMFLKLVFCKLLVLSCNKNIALIDYNYIYLIFNNLNSSVQQNRYIFSVS